MFKKLFWRHLCGQCTLQNLAVHGSAMLNISIICCKHNGRRRYIRVKMVKFLVCIVDREQILLIIFIFSEITVQDISLDGQQVLVETSLPSSRVQELIESTGRRAILLGIGPAGRHRIPSPASCPQV